MIFLKKIGPGWRPLPLPVDPLRLKKSGSATGSAEEFVLCLIRMNPVLS